VIKQSQLSWPTKLLPEVLQFSLGELCIGALAATVLILLAVMKPGDGVAVRQN